MLVLSGKHEENILYCGTESCYGANGKVIAGLPNKISQNGYTIDILKKKKKKYNLSHCT